MSNNNKHKLKSLLKIATIRETITAFSLFAPIASSVHNILKCFAAISLGESSSSKNPFFKLMFGFIKIIVSLSFQTSPFSMVII